MTLLLLPIYLTRSRTRAQVSSVAPLSRRRRCSSCSPSVCPAGEEAIRSHSPPLPPSLSLSFTHTFLHHTHGDSSLYLFLSHSHTHIYTIPTPDRSSLSLTHFPHAHNIHSLSLPHSLSLSLSLSLSHIRLLGKSSDHREFHSSAALVVLQFLTKSGSLRL